MEAGKKEVVLQFPHKRGSLQTIVFGGPPCLSPAAQLCIEGRVDGGRFFDRNIQRSGGAGVILTERADTHILGKFELLNQPGSHNNSTGLLEVRIAGVESPGNVVFKIGTSGPANQLIYMQGDFEGDVHLELSGTHLVPGFRLRLTPPSTIELHSIAEAMPMADDVRSEDRDITNLYNCEIRHYLGNLDVRLSAKSRESSRPASTTRH